MIKTQQEIIKQGYQMKTPNSIIGKIVYIKRGELSDAIRRLL